MAFERTITTKILPVDPRKIGVVKAVPRDDLLDDFHVSLSPDSQDAANLASAAEQLKHSDIPVAFPTETVYGLGADATRSAAVNGIFKAKSRPSDNPLIVHFASLEQLRELLRSGDVNGSAGEGGSTRDPIPEIYRPLIEKFWPGPLTIILHKPHNCPLAPEVMANLNTFGARMPRHVLALALIKLAGVPIAAPSANASTKPSPTAAEHVAFDLDGRIETIIDGGPCDVGVESTVVNGLDDTPLILRPGGISLEQLQTCPGWEKVQIGYKNAAESGKQPMAPGMKYRHYAPKAPVILYEKVKQPPALVEMFQYLDTNRKVGIVTTQRWSLDFTNPSGLVRRRGTVTQTNGQPPVNEQPHDNDTERGVAAMIKTMHTSHPQAMTEVHQIKSMASGFELRETALGSDIASIARGIFGALRELDQAGVDAIFVEGINDSEGDTAAAVMNRLRKAAEKRQERSGQDDLALTGRPGRSAPMPIK